MPVFYVEGSTVVPQDALNFRGGQTQVARPLSGRQRNRGHRSAFTEIGFGKPLLIQIRHLYTGCYPKESFFRRSKDLLVTSALRDLAVYNASPRAVNFIQRDVATGLNLQVPRAYDQGTPVIYYTPAITASSIILTIDISFDNFPEELVKSASTALFGLAGVPMFMPYAGYLMGASTVVKLASEYGNALFDSGPAFSATVRLDFDMPGAAESQSNFRVICEPDFDPTSLNFEEGKGLVTSEGKRYDGKSPYVVVSLDGKNRDNEFGHFTPTLATAALLQRFYSSREKSEATLDGISGVAKVFNDIQFREKALAVKQKMTGIAADSEEHKLLKTRFEALVANIGSDDLKPK